MASRDSCGSHWLGRAPHGSWRRFWLLVRCYCSVAGSHQRRCGRRGFPSRPPVAPQPVHESRRGCEALGSRKVHALRRPRPIAPSSRVRRRSVRGGSSWWRTVCMRGRRRSSTWWAGWGARTSRGRTRRSFKLDRIPPYRRSGQLLTEIAPDLGVAEESLPVTPLSG